MNHNEASVTSDHGGGEEIPMLLSAFGLPVLDQIKYHRLRRDRLHKDHLISTMLWLVAHEVEGVVVVELELDAPPRIAW